MINDGNAISYCNDRVRPISRKLTELINIARQFVYEMDEGMATSLGIPYNLITKETDLTLEDYGTVTPDIYDDGSPSDGRRILSTVEVLALFRVIRFLYLSGVADDARVEKLARKIAFGVEN